MFFYKENSLFYIFLDLLNEPAVHGGQLGLDDYEGDDAADGQLENQHYPVMARKKDVMLFYPNLNYD